MENVMHLMLLCMYIVQLYLHCTSTAPLSMSTAKDLFPCNKYLSYNRRQKLREENLGEILIANCYNTREKIFLSKNGKVMLLDPLFFKKIWL